MLDKNLIKMKIIMRNALKYIFFFLILINFVTITYEHSGRSSKRGKRRDNYYDEHQFISNIPPSDRKVFTEEEFDKPEEFVHRKRPHHKGFKFNRYQNDDQFLKNSDICPEHTILINGDCIASVDVGLINFLAMFIAGGLCLLIFISVIIGLVCLCKKCKRKFKLFKRFKKVFGSKKVRISNNRHQQLNETNNQEDNSYYKADNTHKNNQIEPQNININPNVINQNQYNKNIPIASDYNDIGNRFIINPNNDFNTNFNNDVNNQDNNTKVLNRKLNNSNRIKEQLINQENSINSNNNFLGKKINGILNYFPSLGKKFSNNHNNSNEIKEVKQVEMNLNTNKQNSNPFFTSSSQINNQKKDHSNIDNIHNHHINPFMNKANVNIIQEIPYNYSNNNYIHRDEIDQSKKFLIFNIRLKNFINILFVF